MWCFFDGTPLTIVCSTKHVSHPGWLYHGDPHPYVENHRDIQRFDTLFDAIESRQARSLCVQRTYALGDILMLLPVLRAMLRECNLDLIRLVVRDRFWKDIRQWSAMVPGLQICRWSHINQSTYGCDLGMDLDSVLEVDHRGGWESKRHRCELYGLALGVEVHSE